MLIRPLPSYRGVQIGKRARNCNICSPLLRGSVHGLKVKEKRERKEQYCGKVQQKIFGVWHHCASKRLCARCSCHKFRSGGKK